MRRADVADYRSYCRQAASSAADKTIPADVKSAAGITYPADIGTGVEAEADVEQQRMDQLAINSAGDEEVARANDDPIDCHSDEETYASPRYLCMLITNLTHSPTPRIVYQCLTPQLLTSTSLIALLELALIICATS